MNTRLRPTPSHRRGGFTLMEVAIALALFVVGALAIVQIFPPALAVIRNNENIGQGATLGNGTLSRFNNKISPPPEAIYELGDSLEWVDYPGGIATSNSRSSTLPASPQEADFQASSLSRFRYIYGEPHFFSPGQRIALNRPRAALTSGGTAVPVTAFYYEDVVGVQVTARGYLDFSSAHLASSPSAPFSDTSNPGLIEYGIVAPPDNFRRKETTDPATYFDTLYYVSYRWRECSDSSCSTNPPIQGVEEEPISIPQDGSWGSNSGQVLACATSSLHRAIPGTVKVKMRRAALVTTDEKGDSQNSLIYTQSANSRLFYLSYLSSDWRSMVDDSGPIQKGSSATGVIQLPVKGLDDDPALGGSGIINASLTQADLKADPIVVAPTNVDTKKGEVEYPVPFATFQGPRIRTVYRTLDNWVSQISVAPRFYIPFSATRTGGDFPREPWREYQWSSVDNTVLYFHPGDLGKTVEITYTYDNGSTKGTLTSTATIDEDLIARPASVPTAFIGPGNTVKQLVARLFISDKDGNPDTSVKSILSVRGLSIKARTAWLNKEKYTQVIVPGFRMQQN